MKDFKLDKFLLDTTANMGKIRERTNINTLLAVIAIVLSVIAIVK